jgi:hypothetical protein
MDWQLVAQALALLAGNFFYLIRAVLYLPFAIILSMLRGHQAGGSEHCTFYEGVVTHSRKKPAVNKFR